MLRDAALRAGLLLLATAACQRSSLASHRPSIARDAGGDVAPAPDVLAAQACAPAPRCPSRVVEDDAALDAVPPYRRLREILSGAPGAVDIAEVSLLMGQIDDPELDIAADLATVDRMAEEVRRAMPARCEGRCRLRVLTRKFLRAWRFRPVDDPNGLYTDARYDLLHDVLATREGYCEGLTVAFLALGHRLGIPLAGVLARQHIYVRYTGPDGPVDVDLTRGGAAPERDAVLPGCAPRSGVYGRPLDGAEMAGQVVSVVGILDGIPARRRWIDAAVALAPNDPDLRNNRGADREARYDFEGAAQDYRAAVALDPCVAFYRVNLAGALRRAGRVDEAARVLDEVDRATREGALEDDPLYTSLARGELAMARGEDDLAERYFLRAVSASGGAPVAHEALGRLRMLRGAYADASTSFLAALERDPSPGARLRLAEAMIRAGHASGRAELLRAERDGADAEDVSWLLGLLAAREGRREEAVARALRCLDRVGPDCLEAMVVLGDLSGDPACARRWYAQVARCDLPPRDRERARVESLAARRGMAR